MQAAEVRNAALIHDRVHRAADSGGRADHGVVAEENALRRLRRIRREEENWIVLEEEHAAAVVDVDFLGVHRREHVLEGSNHQLERLVVGGEIVEDQHGRVEEGRRCVHSFLVEL